MRFEDKAGYEEIYFHAQRDMNVHIQNDNHTHIQRDSKQRIDQHRYAEIAGDDHLHVKGTQKALTEGDVFQQVLGLTISKWMVHWSVKADKKPI